MEFFLKFDINIFSIFLLVVLYFTMKLRGEAKGTSSRLFFRLLWLIVFMLFMEIMSWVFDGVPGMNALNYFLNAVFAWMTSLAAGMLASYIDYHMFGSYDRLKKRFFYTHTFVLTGLLILVNFFHPILFSVSPDNIYRREPLMILIPLMNAAVFIYMSFLAEKNKSRIQKEVVWVILLYVFMPMLAAFLQVALFGVFIIWPLMAVTVVLTYIFLETVSTSMDYLTGLLSRNRIDDYLDYMIDNRKPFVFVMMDLDNFKSINDTYGHLKGDLALKLFSRALKKSFKDGKVVGRYAGDEFVLILEKTSMEEIDKRMHDVENEMKNLFDRGEMEFAVQFSYGCHERKKDDDIGYNEIIHFADRRMYENKGRKA